MEVSYITICHNVVFMRGLFDELIHLKLLMQAFYTQVQARLFAVCYTETCISCRYAHTLLTREICRWKFQSKSVVPVSHYYLYNLIHDGSLCFGNILCVLQRSASAFQSSSEVYYNQICHFPHLLAGKHMSHFISSNIWCIVCQQFALRCISHAHALRAKDVECFFPPLVFC